MENKEKRDFISAIETAYVLWLNAGNEGNFTDFETRVLNREILKVEVKKNFLSNQKKGGKDVK